jgi:large subunit ribosomal protein L10
MTKEEKVAVVNDLVKQLKVTPNVYVTDAGGLTVAQVNTLRGLCFKAGVEMRVVKNTLLRKAMEASGRDYSGTFPELKNQSSVFFVAENYKAPAKLIKDFRKKGDKPSLKVAFVEESVFIGDSQLETLENLKGKNELLGELIGLLQSPMQTVMGQLSSGGQKIAGILKTLEERGSSN